MKRIMLLVALLAAAALVRPMNAGACDRAICTNVYDAEGNPVGYGCRSDSESTSNCLATVSSCHMTGCGGAGVVSDGDGRLLAVAEFCRGNLLQLRAASAAACRTSLVFSPHSVSVARSDAGPTAD